MSTWTAASLIILAAVIGVAGGLLLADRIDHTHAIKNENIVAQCQRDFGSPPVGHCLNLQQTFSPYPTLRLHPLDPGRRLSFKRRAADA